MIKQIFIFLRSFFPKKLTIWYMIWFGISSWYLCKHWDEAMVFSPFNGNALILCVWIGMILKPFIGEIDTPWIKAKMNKMQEVRLKAENIYDEALATKNEES